MVDDPREPGQFAGYLNSAGQFGRLFFSVAWGRWSDTHGRKPVVQISLASTMITSLLFGLTLNFYAGICLRFLSGAMDFLFGVIKIYIAEGVEEQHHAPVGRRPGDVMLRRNVVRSSIGAAPHYHTTREPNADETLHVYVGAWL